MQETTVDLIIGDCIKKMQNMKKENIDLANIYLDKIVALKNEKYENMPVLIEKIEELRKKKQ